MNSATKLYKIFENVFYKMFSLQVFYNRGGWFVLQISFILGYKQNSSKLS